MINHDYDLSLEENITFILRKKIHTNSIVQENEHKSRCIRECGYK